MVLGLLHLLSSSSSCSQLVRYYLLSWLSHLHIVPIKLNALIIGKRPLLFFPSYGWVSLISSHHRKILFHIHLSLLPPELTDCSLSRTEWPAIEFHDNCYHLYNVFAYDMTRKGTSVYSQPHIIIPNMTHPYDAHKFLRPTIFSVPYTSSSIFPDLLCSMTITDLTMIYTNSYFLFCQADCKGLFVEPHDKPHAQNVR